MFYVIFSIVSLYLLIQWLHDSVKKELNSDLIHQQNQYFIITNNKQYNTKRAMLYRTRLLPF